MVKAKAICILGLILVCLTANVYAEKKADYVLYQQLLHHIYWLCSGTDVQLDGLALSQSLVKFTRQKESDTNTFYALMDGSIHTDSKERNEYQLRHSAITTLYGHLKNWKQSAKRKIEAYNDAADKYNQEHHPLYMHKINIIQADYKNKKSKGGSGDDDSSPLINGDTYYRM